MTHIDESEFADVIFHATYDDDGNTIDVRGEWEGGDYVRISDELMEDYDPRWMNYDEESGILTMSGFKCEFVKRVLLGETVYVDYWIFKRIREDEKVTA